MKSAWWVLLGLPCLLAVGCGEDSEDPGEQGGNIAAGSGGVAGSSAGGQGGTNLAGGGQGGTAGTAGEGGTAQGGEAGNSSGNGGEAGSGGSAQAGEGGQAGDAGSGQAGDGGSAQAGDGGSGQAGDGGSAQAGDAGSGGSEQGGEAGSGGASGEAGQGGAGAGGAAPVIDRTSQACGAIPILGFQGTDVTDACAACVEASCCEQGAACGADASCPELRECFAGCTDSACSNACDAKFPSNKPSTDFSTCRRSQCGSDCADFACVGAVSWGEPSVASVDVTIRPVNFQTGAPWAGISVKMCAKSDPECTAPLAQTTTNASGEATLSIPTEPGGYAVFLEFTGDGVAPSIGMYGHANPEFFFSQKKQDIPIFSQSTFNLFLSAGGTKADPERGTVTFGMEDCNGNRIAGLTPSASTADAQSTTLYVKGSLPTKNATATDVSGLAGIVNLPPGPVELTGTIAKSAQVFGKIKTQVRKGFVTMTDINPSPLP